MDNNMIAVLGIGGSSVDGGEVVVLTLELRPSFGKARSRHEPEVCSHSDFPRSFLLISMFSPFDMNTHSKGTASLSMSI